MLLTAVPTLFAVSIMPGLCMTLAMTMGMTIGVRRTLWMMAGELTGLALVAVLSIAGVAALMLAEPRLYFAAKLLGGAYLVYVGVRLWMTGHRLTSKDFDHRIAATSGALVRQGFIAAIANPKAWIFYASLLPPFITPTAPFVPQLASLVLALVAIELAALLIYASGGRALKALLQSSPLLRAVNLLAGGAIAFIGGELIFLG
jgi:threonine/homoserine/homoserine lactone efflux protein